MLQQLLYFLKRPVHFIKTGLWRGLVGQLIYRFPARKLKIIAVTGTDGKTTSSTILYQILKTAHQPVGLLSTIAAYINDQQLETGLHVTSPDPRNLQRMMRMMVDAGVKYLVLEVTSHGAYQYRTWGIKPFLAGVTNVTHEHLDYHLTQHQYLQAKTLILKKSQTVVLNQDDQSYHKLLTLTKLTPGQVLTYGAEVKLNSQVEAAIKKRFIEPYNQTNARLAATLATQLEIDHQSIAAGITTFPGLAGRMQEVKTTRPFRVVVDFAHTPHGLESALKALKSQLPKSGRLIAVYGAAGLRDFQKRPLMGKIGAQLADLCVLTAEDPRTEDAWAIIHQLKQDLSTNLNKVISIVDRQQAIEFAINKLARKNDIVGIFGKGHEKSMCVGKTEYPWSDVETARQALTNN